MGSIKQGVGYLIVFFLGIAAGMGGLTLARGVQPAPIHIAPAPTATLPAPTATPGPLHVYVNGRVIQPAVYALPPGSLVEAAIEAAGGMAADANTAVVNLAQPLQNGMQVYVPAIGEEAPAPASVLQAPVEAGNAPPGGAAGGLVNINTADAAALDMLPGIGPSTAQKIIAHRETNGPFATIEGIMEVPGIGEAKFASMQDLITVEGE